jgi:putative PIN family toxin of toxin-antitoxin system
MLNVVLDTNVVLDWLLFADPALNPLPQRIGAGQVCVWTHERAVEELRRVLGYPRFALDAARQTLILESYRAQTRLFAAPGVMSDLPKGFPRCRDSDDDHFLQLAYRCNADALVSKDRALLRLARRSTAFDIAILSVRELVARVT